MPLQGVDVTKEGAPFEEHEVEHEIEFTVGEKARYSGKTLLEPSTDGPTSHANNWPAFIRVVVELDAFDTPCRLEPVLDKQ